MSNIFDSLLSHLQDMEKGLMALSPTKAFAFALACTERQLPIYAKATEGKTWDRTIVGRSVDEAWKHIIADTPLLASLSRKCQDAMPHSDDLCDTADVAANMIANAVADLLTALENAEPHYCHFSAARNIDLLEMLFDERCERYGEASSHEVEQLVAIEVERQCQALGTLQGSEMQAILRVRDASRQKSLFGDVWFPT